jgi:hypothetical protein
MFGPVMSSRRRPSPSLVSLAMNDSPPASSFSTTGWRPPSMKRPGSLEKTWAAVVARQRDVGEAGQQIEHAPRAGDALQLRQIGLQGRQDAS